MVYIGVRGLIGGHGQENAVLDGVDVERETHRESVNSTKKLRRNVACSGKVDRGNCLPRKLLI